MKSFYELQEDYMSPRRMDFIYTQVGFRNDQIIFLDIEARRRGVPRVQVVRDAIDHYRLFLRNGSTGEKGQPIDNDPQP
jgi:hypothetical protein